MSAAPSRDSTSFLDPVLGDGRPLLFAVAGSLVFSGGFALFLAAAGEFLPHDVHYLGMSAADLCRTSSCRIVDFMVHDRAAFAGTLVGLGVLYVWLTAFLLGMARSRRLLTGRLEARRLVTPARGLVAASTRTWGRVVLLFGAAATAVGGLTITWVGFPSR